VRHRLVVDFGITAAAVQVQRRHRLVAVHLAPAAVRVAEDSAVTSPYSSSNGYGRKAETVPLAPHRTLLPTVPVGNGPEYPNDGDVRSTAAVVARYGVGRSTYHGRIDCRSTGVRDRNRCWSATVVVFTMIVTRPLSTGTSADSRTLVRSQKRPCR
jgi:hypothetical protein